MTKHETRLICVKWHVAQVCASVTREKEKPKFANWHSDEIIFYLISNEVFKCFWFNGTVYMTVILSCLKNTQVQINERLLDYRSIKACLKIVWAEDKTFWWNFNINEKNKTLST